MKFFLSYLLRKFSCPCSFVGAFLCRSYQNSFAIFRISLSSVFISPFLFLSLVIFFCFDFVFLLLKRNHGFLFVFNEFSCWCRSISYISDSILLILIWSLLFCICSVCNSKCSWYKWFFFQFVLVRCKNLWLNLE